MKKNATPKAIFCDRAREAKDLTWPPPGILARTTDIHRITASTTGIPLPPDRWQPLPEIRWAQSPRLQAVAEDVAVLNGLDKAPLGTVTCVRGLLSRNIVPNEFRVAEKCQSIRVS